MITLSERKRLLSEAHRETIDGLLVVHTAGTPYQMGFQHGSLCREEIHGFRAEAYAYMAKLIAGPLHLPPGLARVVTRPLLMQQVRGYWPFTPQEYRDEMQGMADGAGVNVLEALLVNAVWEMYLAGGCSEFAVRGAKSADGELLHGYNYDLADPAHGFINPYLALIFARPADGYAFAQVNTAGCVGANAGISAAGISVAWDNTHLRPGSTLLTGLPKRCTPFELALRQLLQYADSLEAGVEIIRSHLPRRMADIIIIGDGKARNAKAMEMAGAIDALRPMQPDAVWSANSFASARLGPEDRRGMPSADLEETGARLGRYASYTELIERTPGKVDVQQAVEILRDPYPRERCGYVHPTERQRTICRPVTSFSLVMQPKAGRLWVGDARIPAPLGRYIGFDLRTEAPLDEPAIRATGFHEALEAHTLFSNGRYAEALRRVEKAIELDGPSVPHYSMAAQIYKAMQEPEAAGRCYEMRRRLAGKDPGTSPEVLHIAYPSAINPLAHLP